MQTNSNSSLNHHIQAIVAEAIQVPVELMTPDLAFGDLPEWDSMGHMEVMMILEQHYGVEINADTIAKLISIPEIQKYLEENGHVS